MSSCKSCHHLAAAEDECGGKPRVLMINSGVEHQKAPKTGALSRYPQCFALSGQCYGSGVNHSHFVGFEVAASVRLRGVGLDRNIYRRCKDRVENQKYSRSSGK